MKQILWGLVCWIVTVTIVNAASFDCGKASTKVEKLICSDAELSKLDEELGNAYLQAMERIQKSNDQSNFKQRFIKSQRQWLKNERNVCQSIECIRASYGRRIKEVNFAPSFGFVFTRPQKVELPSSSSQFTTRTAEPQMAVPSVETPKTQTAQQQMAPSIADCATSTIAGITKLPKSEVISQLIGISKAQFEKQQFECATQSLEQANKVVRSVADGAERAAMGFEIKDAVFVMVQQGTLPDFSIEKRAIMAAIQSMDTNGTLVKTASEDERFNDAAFLGRLSDYYLDHRRKDDFSQTSSMMLIADFTLPANRRFVDSLRMSRHINVLAYKLELVDLALLLDDAPNSMRDSLGKEIANTIRQAISNYDLIGVTLLSLEKAKQDVEALNKLLPVIETEKSGKSDFWIWPIYRYMAEAYWQTGDKEKAREMISKARTSILSSKYYPKGSSTELGEFARSLCKYIRIKIGKGTQMCPIGIYDDKEMSALIDEVERVAKLASDSHALLTAEVLRKDLLKVTP